MVFDGHFCMAKSGFSMRPIYQRNHPSFEGNDETKRVFIPTITQWFDSGALEYVCRWHRMPRAVLATGSVTKASAPWHRAVTDCGPVNGYAFSWKIKYITVADICLMLRPCSLMTVLDLRAAYHLVLFGGCTGLAQIVARWVTNHDGTGVQALTFHAGGLRSRGLHRALRQVYASDRRGRTRGSFRMRTFRKQGLEHLAGHTHRRSGGVGRAVAGDQLRGICGRLSQRARCAPPRDLQGPRGGVPHVLRCRRGRAAQV